MNKLFVTYKQAAFLTKLGFNEPCFGYYSLSHTSDNYNFSIIGEPTNFGRDYYINFVGKGLKNSDMNINPVGRLNMCYTAPLKQQAIDWFIEKYQLEGVVQRASEYEWYKYTIYDLTNSTKKYVRDSYKFKTKEEALNACIDCLIKYVKDNKI